MSLSAKRRGRALRELLLTDVVFSNEEADRIAATCPHLAGAMEFMGCRDNDEDGPYRDDIVTWSMRGHSGPGLYVQCEEYPEEGTWFVPMLLGDALATAKLERTK